MTFGLFLFRSFLLPLVCAGVWERGLGFGVVRGLSTLTKTVGVGILPQEPRGGPRRPLPPLGEGNSPESKG